MTGARLMTALHHAEHTANAIASHHSLRPTLADELGTDPAPTTQQVFRSLPTPGSSPAGSVPLDSRPAASHPTNTANSDGAAPHAEPTRHTPFQMPRDVPDFTGRAAELTALRKRLLSAPADGLPAVLAISGMGGIGKTAHALHAARGTRAAFSDGQLYAELRGLGSGIPRSPLPRAARPIAFAR
ncbi:hypothetical protein J7E97_30900 [Streptomyces sp. ISL-66]|uniref:BTAD domain-containing putative transcriptional regulator n=1 Tax=Streptomyces sp. ISL-66 TaxID=2819186 RepID=UPI001BE5CD1C|nr:BTAD domain-containing putative transcriptional regulator [Streptomyces sp. ISL-66]MBT2472150.1 hypothetical protein [Streptomyces sp. ISL-66]